jgi:hypothetical protein
MSDFDLDLRAVEDMMDDEDAAEGGVVLGVLDGSTPPDRWARAATADGSVLVLAIEGDVNELAAGFAGDVRDAGGDLIQFREFLVVAPPGVGIDRSRL